MHDYIKYDGRNCYAYSKGRQYAVAVGMFFLCLDSKQRNMLIKRGFCPGMV